MLLVKKYEGGHWTPETIDQRWEYHSRVVELVKSLNISSPSSVLEMGTMGISCVDNSDTIDYLERWDFPGKEPTYVHDSRVTPWPIKDKQYEVFIALRVFQHLTPSQKEATKEAMRIARKVIIAVPDFYKNKEIAGSKGITYSEFVDFLGGIHPTLYFSTRDEYIYYWDVENPSTLNLEAVMRQTRFYNHQALISNTQENAKSLFILEKTKKAARALIGKGRNGFQKIMGWRTKSGRNNLSSSGGKRASLHIEFVGHAGIGKSTLCDELKKHVIGDWLYKEDLPDILPKFLGSESNEDQYLLLLGGKIKNLDHYSLTSYQKLSLVRYFSDVLLKDLVRNSSELSPKKFFLDEGLCHNFFEELVDLPDADLKTLMAGRALVFMQARTNDTIINRIRKREKETGRMTTYHVGLNDDQLKDLAELNLSLFNDFVDRAEALGVPICKIFAEDGLQKNVNQVLEFEKSIVQLD